MHCRLARCVSLNPNIMLPLCLSYLVSYLMTFTPTFPSSIKLQNMQGTIITLIHNFTMSTNTIACMFLFFFLISKSSSLIAKPTVEERYKNWLVQYGRRSHNNTLEMENRFAIYKSNVELIDDFNSQNHSFSLTDNKFADMTNEEFKAMNVFNIEKQDEIKEYYEDFINDPHVLPSNLDWRKKGAVVDVKNQGPCGSCWAFSAVGAVESLTKIKTGKLISLSEQELLDCDVYGNDSGCFGGLLSSAYEFIVNHGSLTTSNNYPYTGKPGTCNKKQVAKKTASINGYKRVIPCNESLLLRAVANQPVSVAITASRSTFQLYSEGIYNDVRCSHDKPDHAVVIVGYGSSGGHDYWIVKNSWGHDWGDAGYIRIARNVPNVKSGVCGIATQPYYPY